MMMNEQDEQENAAAKEESLVKYLLGEVDGALKRERSWRKEATATVKIYEAEAQTENSYNILFSNTDTLLPSLYNSLPRPEVRRRFKDEDPLGLMASKVVERTLEYLLDTDLNEKEPFDETLTSSVLEALVPGRGVVWVKYDAVLGEKALKLPMPSAMKPRVGDEESAEHEEAEGEDNDGTPKELTKKVETVEAEYVCAETVPWDRFIHGYGKKWRDVPWVGRVHIMTKEEIEDNFGKEVALGMEWVAETDCEEGDGEEGKERETSSASFATVYEIWHKRNRKVYFVSPSYKGKLVKSIEDPLRLSGFFPTPRPLMLVRRISSLTPQTLYAMYKAQAEELNRVTLRINKIIGALKVRGVYDNTIGELAQVLAADDNILIPAENVAALQQGQSLERAIWLMPIDKLITVLQQLYAQRQQVKQVIFEITGIADIMRGSSQASETLGAQELKNQWGTLRLRKAQREVQRFVVDILRLMAEAAVTHLSPETLKKMTGLPFPLAEEKAQAQATLQQMQSVPPQPGQPPQEPPQDVQQAAALPSWDEVMALLQDDIQRSYRIDIETNSTVDLEATEDKEDAGELLNALAQFFNGIGPLVAQGTLPFEAAKAILLGLIRRFRFGDDVEDALQQMQAPQPPQSGGKEAGPSPEELQAKQAQAKVDMEVAKMDLELKRAEHAMKMEELQMKQREMQMKFRLSQQQALMPSVPAGNPPDITNQ